MIIVARPPAGQSLLVEPPRTQQAEADGARSLATAAQPKAAIIVFNPRSRFDVESGVFIMEFRSPQTGEIERRFPDEQQLRAYTEARRVGMQAVSVKSGVRNVVDSNGSEPSGAAGLLPKSILI